MRRVLRARLQRTPSLESTRIVKIPAPRSDAPCAPRSRRSACWHCYMPARRRAWVKPRRRPETSPARLDPSIVTQPKRKPVKRAQTEADRVGARTRATGRTRATTAKPIPGPANATNTPVALAPTPLNTNVVATSASRLGLTAFEMPASVEIVYPADDARARLPDHDGNCARRGRRTCRRFRRRAGWLFHARLYRQRDKYPLQRNMDRPPGYYLAHHGYGQPKPRGVSQRSVVADVRAGCDRRVGQLRDAAADHWCDQERIGYLDQFASRLSDTFRLGWQHDGARARLSRRYRPVQGRQLHRRRLSKISPISRGNSTIR